jgi:hypothetical protein
VTYDFLFRYVDICAVVILTALLVIPVLIYLFTGWSVRRSEIVGAMSSKGAALYFKQFYPALRPERDVLKAFSKHYQRRYGRRHYLIPLALLGIVAIFLLIMTTHTILNWLLNQSSATNLPPVAVGATAGAYMWVAGDILIRCRGRQLAPTDLYWAALRFVIAIPLAFAFAGILKDEAAVGIAFLLGAFPTNTLLTIARRIGNRKLGLSEGGEEAQSEVEQIQGITSGLAERFRDEGVSTILQPAYSDPVDLTIRTSFSFNYVIDCISQSLAWLYLEKDLEKSRRLSLRGAQEINTLITELRDGSAREQATATATISHIAAQLNMDRDVLERLLCEIAFDPYTEFIVDLWHLPDDAGAGSELPRGNGSARGTALAHPSSATKA